MQVVFRRMSSGVRGVPRFLPASQKTKATLSAAAVIALIVAVLMAVLPAAAGAAGAQITVTNQNDSGPGSLRQAIDAAAAGDTVILPAGTYPVSSGELLITKSLTIAGAGAATTFIDAQTAQPASRVVHTLGAGNQITISNVTIRNGTAMPLAGQVATTGGGLLNDQATVTLSDDVITGNKANADGRGLTAGAGGSAEGGGIFNAGSLNLVDTDVQGNKATAVGTSGQGGQAQGGGVFSTGTLSARGSTFDGNLADAHTGTGQRGGVAVGGGMALSQNAAAAEIVASTFHDNVSDASGTFLGPPTAVAGGGGAMLDNGSGAISETNVTYAGNVVRAAGGRSHGGAILFNGLGTGESLTNATIVGNSAAGGFENRGGNIFVEDGARVGIENTVVSAGAGDAGSENCFANGTGTFSSLGDNLDSRDQCSFHASGDRVDTDPLLAALQANGGPVETAALKPGSPAIDSAAAGVCPTADARGVRRPVGGGCDIGAFEVATPSATTGQASSVATGSAVLNAIASNPDLSPGTGFFQFGTTTAYGSSTAPQPINSMTAMLALSAQLNGLTPGTTYHFRIVASNATATVTGADRTFTTAPAPGPTTTPVLTARPPGNVPTGPQVAVRSASIAGATARIRLACRGTTGQRCSGTVLGTVRERLRGGSIVSIDSSAAGVSRPLANVKRVVVASGTFSVSAGHTAILQITANATGKKLLQRFYRLPATVVFAGPNGLSRTITFAFPRVRLRVMDFFISRLPPCGRCTTAVQQLTLIRLPGRSRVTVSCRGVGCPFARRELRPRGRNLALAALFSGSRLHTGTKLEIRITAPNRVGEALLYTIRTGALPRATTLCLPPGARSPVTCRAGS